jgi:hypothetical protein
MRRASSRHAAGSIRSSPPLIRSSQPLDADLVSDIGFGVDGVVVGQGQALTQRRHRRVGAGQEPHAGTDHPMMAGQHVGRHEPPYGGKVGTCAGGGHVEP